jgi:hypothetical protein
MATSNLVINDHKMVDNWENITCDHYSFTGLDTVCELVAEAQDWFRVHIYRDFLHIKDSTITQFLRFVI